MVCLTTEDRTKKFLESMLSRPGFAQSMVEALCLNVSVGLDTAVAILAACSGLKYLNMRVPCHLFGKNPILEPLEKLSRLTALYVDLASIFNTKVVYLPDVQVFHSVTHLHLSNAWASWSPVSNSIGLEHLTQITHLSLYLSTVRTHPVPLKEILDRRNLSVLVFWKRSFVSDSAAMQFLEDSNLQDDRVVVLDEGLFRHHMLDDRFWECAERVVKQRQESGGEYEIVPNSPWHRLIPRSSYIRRQPHRALRCRACQCRIPLRDRMECRDRCGLGVQ